MSDELHSKNQELEQTSARKQELQLEVASLRKDLQAAHENFCTLEVEVRVFKQQDSIISLLLRRIVLTCT